MRLRIRRPISICLVAVVATAFVAGKPPAMAADTEGDAKVRTWTRQGGSFEARYARSESQYEVLEGKEGAVYRVLTSTLSEADRDYIRAYVADQTRPPSSQCPSEKDGLQSKTLKVTFNVSVFYHRSPQDDYRD